MSEPIFRIRPLWLSMLLRSFVTVGHRYYGEVSPRALLLAVTWNPNHQHHNLDVSLLNGWLTIGYDANRYGLWVGEFTLIRWHYQTSKETK